MKHFVLTTEFGPNIAEERKPYRAAHLQYLNLLVERGDLVLAGAFADFEGGMMIFKAENADAIERIVAGDPYTINNVTKSWRVREWTTVAGEGALTKVVLT
jgi:uncharacterized protein YciI